ncbi:endoribonuclease l-psp [Grosmannia clavigera kw1407]|uniref:Endoribonuclease l-psp n=1 Tax=Grosmannia clavigera (strain kw1407 / UAMH 11150) TaxID=655863 RepID=F0XFM1_GROCL|nr:endoribonuclease l-psp [Grosmannia clavigera kw1407]EFX04607.1 endoribonuclease l-psp [Grosmannia clavigera kw1407]
MAQDRQLISSGSAFEAQIGYSRAVVSGDWVFISGCTGYDYATGELRTGAADQADQALRNIAAALAQVGPDVEHEPVTMADVVRVRYILPDRNLFAQTWPVLQQWFGGERGARPAATMMQAGLLEEAMLIEVEVTARRPKKISDGLNQRADVSDPPL